MQATYRMKLSAGAALAALLVCSVMTTPVLADTIEAALVRAYQNNPQLNAQRASVRATDESVPQALSGDVLLVLSNGGFGGIHRKLIEAL